MSQISVLLPLVIPLVLHLYAVIADDSLRTYIVHVDPPDTQFLCQDLETWYRSFLPENTANLIDPKPRMIYSYRNVFSGFAAKLTSEEVTGMEKKRGFISARPQNTLSLHTTRTPSFLGLRQNMGIWRDSSYGKGVIIGILDTGIFPDHPSFSDEGIPAPPAKWRGKCEFNLTSAGCNNKLIGARNFLTSETGSPLDIIGHGTHAAGTAAGNFVKGANVFGNANGTAVGIAPLAHLAVYKACSGEDCAESAILMAMDAAIEDGVDVISISFGGTAGTFDQDSVALGAFSAMEKGIFVCCSAGNKGPFPLSLSNEAPWVLTVGASTVDRKFTATAVLGNNLELDGESAFQPHDLPHAQLPLVYPVTNDTFYGAVFCLPSTLINTDVKGMIVLCDVGGGISKIEQGQAVKDAGGAAMILINVQTEGFSTSAEAHVLPATVVNNEDGQKILAYINSTSTPTATILFKGTIIGDNNAPVVASFSSRGPSFTSRGILKPDIIGPGVNILAAWPINEGNIENIFNIFSGTSVSSSHLSGVAALIKSMQPDWSPAAIKSAIMTTADVLNLNNQPIQDQRHLLPAEIFATGSGHVNPSRAADPGLIYDIEPQDYIPYLCGLNYTNREVGRILLRRVNCLDRLAILEGQLNYPSFTIRLQELSSNLTFSRTVTNVGVASSSYTIEVVSPQGIDVTVEPGTLNFSELKQKMAYKVRFTRSANAGNISSISHGYIVWKSAKYSVRSPIAALDI